MLCGKTHRENVEYGLLYYLKANSKKSAFTLIELLVVVAIISLLVSILLPSLNKAKDLAKGVMCMTNLRTNCTAMMLYANDYGGLLPMQIYLTNGTLIRWIQLLDGGSSLGTVYNVPECYLDSHGSSFCPSAEPFKFINVGYTYGANVSPNSNARPKPTIVPSSNCDFNNTSILDITQLMSTYWLLTDSWSALWKKQSYGIIEDPLVWGGIGGVNLRHAESEANVLLGDGHVETMNSNDMYNIGFRSGYDAQQANTCILFEP